VDIRQQTARREASAAGGKTSPSITAPPACLRNSNWAGFTPNWLVGRLRNLAQARLNLGDCAAYALAKGMNAPLFYKGTDFASTHIVSASV
jgi:hypothetical protein